MKVLMIIDSLIAGGKERRLVQLLKGLQQYDDVECELVVLSDRIHYKEVYDLGIKIHIIIRKPAQDPRTIPKLYRICKNFKPDILHTWDSMGSIFAFPIAKITGAKLVNGMIVAAPLKLKRFSNLWLRSKITFPFSNMILSNSKAGLESFGVADSKKATYVHNGIDMSRFENLREKKEMREELGVTQPIVIGMVAAFSERKDWPTFIELANLTLSERKDICFLCVGGGDLLDEIKARVLPENKDNVIFTGPRNDVENIINIFDIGVLSTITEGIPNSIIEYMSLGKVVVATGAGGTKELVHHGRTGFLIKRRQPDKLYRHIKFLLNNEEEAQKMGANGYRQIVENFTLEVMTKRFIEVYQKVLKK